MRQANLQSTYFIALVKRFFREHKRRYGSRRIVLELQEQSYQLGR
ncbi:IS3 family transposase [Spirosoma flavum]|uniref:IS3 family transposase n=1 Tax=Spirosoma flavum TaxID=2048557 RepID=A0ABW6AUI2_9BACT